MAESYCDYLIENDLLGAPTPPRIRRTNVEIERAKREEYQMFSTLMKDILPTDCDYVTHTDLKDELLCHSIILSDSISPDSAWHRLRKKYLGKAGWEINANPADKSGRYRSSLYPGKVEVWKRKTAPKLNRFQLTKMEVI